VKDGDTVFAGQIIGTMGANDERRLNNEAATDVLTNELDYFFHFETFKFDEDTGTVLYLNPIKLIDPDLQ